MWCIIFHKLYVHLHSEVETWKRSFSYTPICALKRKEKKENGKCCVDRKGQMEMLWSNLDGIGLSMVSDSFLSASTLNPTTVIYNRSHEKITSQSPFSVFPSSLHPIPICELLTHIFFSIPPLNTIYFCLRYQKKKEGKIVHRTRRISLLSWLYK